MTAHLAHSPTATFTDEDIERETRECWVEIDALLTRILTLSEMVKHQGDAKLAEIETLLADADLARIKATAN